jgi:hypothetical protein
MKEKRVNSSTHIRGGRIFVYLNRMLRHWEISTIANRVTAKLSAIHLVSFENLSMAKVPG